MQADVKQSNESEGSRKVFQGAFNMHVTAVNPTLDELKKMGVNTDKEPEYFTYDKEKKELKDGIKIRVYLENKFKDDTVKAVVTFFLKKKFMESKKNPVKPTVNFIDKKGNTIFLNEEDVTNGNIPYTWLDADSLKKAVIGEPELIAFIRSLTNAEREGVTMFENADLKKIFAGDVSSIRSVVKRANEVGNAVRVLLLPKIVDAKVVQYVYDKSFDRSWSATSKYMHKSVMDNKIRIPNGVVIPFSDTLNESEFFVKEVDSMELISKYGGQMTQNNSTSVPSAMENSLASTNVNIDDMTRDVADDDLPF